MHATIFFIILLLFYDPILFVNEFLLILVFLKIDLFIDCWYLLFVIIFIIFLRLYLLNIIFCILRFNWTEIQMKIVLNVLFLLTQMVFLVQCRCRIHIRVKILCVIVFTIFILIYLLINLGILSLYLFC